MRAELAAVLLLAAAAPAQQVISEVRPDRTFLGKEVDYYVQARGAKEAQCQVPEVPGLTFELVDSGVTSRGTQITIINGRRSVQESSDYTLRYRVTPARPGRFEIPGSKVTVNGEAHRTNPCVLTVEDPGADDRAVVEFRCEPPHVVLGQAAELVVDVFLKHLPKGQRVEDPLELYDRGQGFFDSGQAPPEITLPWVTKTPQGLGPIDLNAWVRGQQSQSGGFRFAGVRGGRFVQRDQVTDVEREDSTGAKVRYRRYRFHLPIRGEVAGTYEFPPAVLDGALVAQVGSRFVWRDAFARSAPLKVEVLEPPVEGRPATFGGAVGHFDFEMEPPTPTLVNVGDPVYVTLLAKGRGFLKGVGLDLGSQLGTPFRVERVGVTDSLPAGAERPPGFPDRPGHWRQWDFKVYPVDASVKALPPVAFSWYDPERRSYATASTKPVPITVRRAADNGEKVVVAGAGNGGNREVELVPTDALSANVTDLNLLTGTAPGPWIPLAILLALPFGYFTLAFFVRRSRRLRDDPALLRRRRAGARALQRLKEARQATGTAALTGAHDALRGYVADLTDRDEEALTSDDLSAWLAGACDDAALRRQVADLGEAVEAATYGGGSPAPDQLTRLVQGLDRLIQQTRGAAARGALLCLAAILPIGAAPAQDTALLNQAQAAFANRDFGKAAECYERVLADGHENGYLLYNLGNAYLRGGDLGRAIAAYRRAHLYLPGDANLEVNLRRALEARTSPLSPPERLSILDYVLFWRPHLGFAAIVDLTLSVAVLAFALAVWRLLAGRPMPAVKWTVAALTAATLLLATSAFLRHDELTSRRNAVVVAGGVVLRTGPGETFEPRLQQTLGTGAELEVESSREGWLKVLAGGEHEGWVAAGDVVRW